MNIYRLTEKEYKRILMFKRDLHMHPELSRKEVRTSAKIRDFLSTLPDFRILPLETETGTGVAAQITGEPKKAGREAPQDGSLLQTEIMLRADIDALPQTEAYEIFIQPHFLGRRFFYSAPKKTGRSGTRWIWCFSRPRRERPAQAS